MSKRYKAKEHRRWFYTGVDLPLGTKVRFQVWEHHRQFETDPKPWEGVYMVYPYGGFCIRINERDHWTTGVEWFEPIDLRRKVGVFKEVP